LVSPDQQKQVLAAFFTAAAVVSVALAVLAGLRGTSTARWLKVALLLAAAVACAVAVIVALRAVADVPVMHYGAGVLGVAVLGAWLVERYARIAHGVRGLGHVLVAATVIGLCLDGSFLLPEVTTQAEWMLTAALNV